MKRLEVMQLPWFPKPNDNSYPYNEGHFHKLWKITWNKTYFEVDVEIWRLLDVGIIQGLGQW